LGHGELTSLQTPSTRGFFAHIVGAISLASHKLLGFAFVDNTDLCIMHDILEVAKHMQGSVSTWEGLLCATGRVLVPNKCFWYLTLNVRMESGHTFHCTDYQARCMFLMTKANALPFPNWRPLKLVILWVFT